MNKQPDRSVIADISEFCCSIFSRVCTRTCVLLCVTVGSADIEVGKGDQISHVTFPEQLNKFINSFIS